MSSPLRVILAKFGFDVDDKKLDNAKAKTEGFAGIVKNFAKVVAAGAIVSTTRAWITQLEQQAGALEDNAIRLGVTTKALQQWQVAAEMAGLTAEQIQTAMRILQKNAANAAGGIRSVIGATNDLSEGGEAPGKVGEAFKSLGIDVKDASGQIKGANVLMREVGLAISKIEDPAIRTQIALQIFGKQGAELATLFAQGSEGLDEALSTLDKFGGGLSDEFIPLAQSYGDRLAEMNVATLSFKSTVAVYLFPIFISAIKFLANLVAAFTKATKGTEVIRAALLTLGAALLFVQRQAIATAIKTIIAWAPFVIMVALLALLIDDVWTAMKGGDSVLAAFLDKIFGPGAGKAIFKQIGEDVDELGKKLDKLPGWGEKIEEVFSTIGASIVKFLVETIPEAWYFFWKDINKELAEAGPDFNRSVQVLFGQLLAWFVNWVKDTTKAIIDGLVNGLKDGWVKVSDTFKELGEELIQDFKDTFKINSPSAVAHDLTEYIPMGSVKALAEWAPIVREQAQETFAPMLPTAPTFAPTIRIPGPVGSREPTTKRVDMHNDVRIYVGSGVGMTGARDGTREGVSLAFGDERRAMIAALEDTA